MDVDLVELEDLIKYLACFLTFFLVGWEFAVICIPLDEDCGDGTRRCLVRVEDFDWHQSVACGKLDVLVFVLDVTECLREQ